MEVSEDNLGMRCVMCQAHSRLADTKSLFKGMTSFTKDILVSHDTNMSHSKCQAAFQRQQVRRRREQGKDVDPVAVQGEAARA